MPKPHAAGVDALDVRGTDEQVGTGAQHDFSSAIQADVRFRSAARSHHLVLTVWNIY
jgi:hypothetical protein